MLNGWFARYGVLRGMLLLAALAIAAVGPFVDDTVHIRDWRVLPSVVAPSLMMILLFALPLDMTMTCIFMTDATGAERARLRGALRAEALVFGLLVLTWIPFMTKVLDLWPFD